VVYEVNSLNKTRCDIEINCNYISRCGKRHYVIYTFIACAKGDINLKLTKLHRSIQISSSIDSFPEFIQ